MSGTRKNLFFSLAEKYAGFAISLVSMVILSRILTPAETGLYSIAAALINIAQTLRNFGAYVYLLQERNLTEEKIGSAVGAGLIIACILTIIFIGAAHAIALFYKNLSLAPLIVILSANFILVAYTAIGHGLMIRNMAFRANMLISIASAVVNAVVSIILALLGFGAACLAWSSLAGVVAALVGNILVLGRQAVIRPNLRHWRTVLHFGAFSSASGILAEISNRTPDLLIGRLVSLEGAGLFSRGGGLVNAVSSLITGAVQPVVASIFAKTHRDEADLPVAYLQAVSYVCIIAWPALTILAVLAHPVVELAFGAQWLPSVPVAQVLCAGTAIGIVGMLAQTLLRSMGDVRQNLIIQLIAVPAYVVGIAVGATAGLTEAATGSIISGTIISALSVAIMHRSIGLGVGALLRVLWPALLAAAAAGAAAFVAIFAIGSLLLSLALGGGLAGIAWLVTIHVLRHPVRDEVHHLYTYFSGRQSNGTASQPSPELHMTNDTPPSAEL